MTLNPGLAVLFGYGVIAANIILNALWGACFHLYFDYLALMIGHVGGYHMKLYFADPSSSPVIGVLSSIFNRGLFIIVSLSVALNLLFYFYRGLVSLPNFAVLTVLIWVFTIALFWANQAALGQLIQRTKRESLQTIQSQIETLHVSQKVLQADTLSQLQSLMDYHDRISGTKNTALNLQVVMEIFASLLIPLVGTVIANLDKLRTLFP
jgi:hypothetical protein